MSRVRLFYLASARLFLSLPRVVDPFATVRATLSIAAILRTRESPTGRVSCSGAIWPRGTPPPAGRLAPRRIQSRSELASQSMPTC